MIRRLAVAFALLLCLTVCGAASVRQDEADFLQRVVASTVLIQTETGSGSGTVVYSDGQRILVLTCAHVIEGDKRIEVVSPFGRLFAKAEKVDAERDLALLVAQAKEAWPVLHLASTEPKLYSRVYAIGAPMGRWGQVSEGFISGLREHLSKTKQTLYRISGAFVYPGISGGTATNAQGELVCVPSNGVATENDQFLTQIGYCVSLVDIRKFLEGYKL